jgi:hypothetical protein
MTEKTATSNNHMGTKFLGLFFGMILSIIYTVKVFFSPSFNVTTDMPSIIFVWAMFLFVIPLLIYLAEIVWRYAHAYSEKFPVQITLIAMAWKLKHLSLLYIPLHR